MVDLRQRLQVGDRNALVDHVHRLPDETEFDDRAVILNETRIRRAARRRELRRLAGDVLDGGGERGDQRIVARQEDMAGTIGPDDVVADRLAAWAQRASTVKKSISEGAEEGVDIVNSK